MKFKYNILDKDRYNLLSLLKNFKTDFYLAGGIGLALQLGHRDSIDFDFFSYKSFDTVKGLKKFLIALKLKKYKKKRTL